MKKVLFFLFWNFYLFINIYIYIVGSKEGWNNNVDGDKGYSKEIGGGDGNILWWYSFLYLSYSY